MKILRTPDSRFEGLPDYPFAPHYSTIRDADGTELRIHTVDEGPRDAAPVLMLHGEPSWSFLYRKMIAGLVAKGHRAVAPDLIGFGKSDKPTEQSDYTFERHVKWMSDWLVAQDLKQITLFCQDWGGLIGLRLVAAFPERFARVVVANTGLPVGTGMTEGFKQWLNFSQSVPELPIGEIVCDGNEKGFDRRGESRLRRAVPGRNLQSRRAALPCPGSGNAGACFRRREQGGVGGACRASRSRC